MAGNVEKLGAGIAYQIEGKARVVEHSGGSTMGSKALLVALGHFPNPERFADMMGPSSAAIMGWETEKMGLYRPDYIVNGGGRSCVLWSMCRC